MKEHEEKLKAIFDEYAKKLPDKIASIEMHWYNLLSMWDYEKLVDYHREVHSLCGSSGTYGYPELSKSARQFEIYLKSLVSNNSQPTAEEVEEANELLINLKNTFTTELSLVSSVTKTAEAKKTALKINKLIYLLDETDSFYTLLHYELRDFDYQIAWFSKITDLIVAIDKNKPIMIISDTHYIEESNFEAIIKMSIPIVYLSEKDNLLIRLMAVRHHGMSFFVKSQDINKLTYFLNDFCGTDLSEPYRVLIIDDSESLAEYYSLILKDAGMITAVLTKPLQLIKTIEEFNPDLLLMDVYMPECTGLELAAVLRQQPLYTSLPIIFLSTEDDRFKQLSALSMGGDDFLTKPVLAQHLVATIQSRAKRSGILTAYIMRDSLTGLLNHVHIMQQLTLEIQLAQRKLSSLAFVMIDIDHFKNVNDTYGHPVGDYVLKKLSQLLSTQLRKTDIVGRYGGEEFALILPGADIKTAMSICNDIRQKFSLLNFSEQGQPFKVTLSAGMATFPALKDVDSLVEAADHALYQAKHAGRNQVKYYDASYTSSSS